MRVLLIKNLEKFNVELVKVANWLQGYAIGKEDQNLYRLSQQLRLSINTSEREVLIKIPYGVCSTYVRTKATIDSYQNVIWLLKILDLLEKALKGDEIPEDAEFREILNGLFQTIDKVKQNLYDFSESSEYSAEGSNSEHDKDIPHHELGD